MTDQQKTELDEWISHNVIGWKRIDSRFAERLHLSGVGKEMICIDNPYFPAKYTTDPVAAMEVLKRCVEKLDGYEVSVGLNQYALNEREKWMVCSTCRRGHQSISDSLELAICLFAQKLFSEVIKPVTVATSS